jgi:hypothetical protein
VQPYAHAAADLPVVIRSKKTSIGFQVPPIRNAPDNALLQILGPTEDGDDPELAVQHVVDRGSVREQMPVKPG